MAFKLVVLLCAVAAANAGLLGGAVSYAAAPALSYAAAPVAVHAPAIGASQQSVVRSLDGNHAVSTYAKQVDTAFSTVRKFDTRVSNDAIGIAHAPVAYAAHAPVATYAAHAPVATYAAHAPVAAYAAHAPVATYAAAAPAIAHAAPLAYAAPGVVKTSTAAVAGHGLLGVAYSAAPVVSHMTYSNGLGLSYAW